MRNSVTLSSSVNQCIKKRTVIVWFIICIVIVLIALDTKVIRIGSSEDVRKQEFSIDEYGVNIFPDIQKSVENRAVPASQLAELLKENRQSATEKYGVGSPMPVFPVSFTGVVKEGKIGIYNIAVTGLPTSVHIRLQTGPAITGTDLRDSTGKIQFGDFKNQIEYQNAAASINQEMKKIVLSPVDTSTLSGKTIHVVGVFRLLNPDNWLVTPVRIDLQ